MCNKAKQQYNNSQTRIYNSRENWMFETKKRLQYSLPVYYKTYSVETLQNPCLYHVDYKTYKRDI